MGQVTTLHASSTALNSAFSRHSTYIWLINRLQTKLYVCHEQQIVLLLLLILLDPGIFEKVEDSFMRDVMNCNVFELEPF